MSVGSSAAAASGCRARQTSRAASASSRVLVRAISISGLPPFGGLSAGPSSSASRSSGSSDPTASSIGSQGSPRSAKRAGTVAIVNSSGRQPGTSSQVNGIDTRASGVARTE